MRDAFQKQNFYCLTNLFVSNISNERSTVAAHITYTTAGTLLPHCCYSESYLIALFCASRITGPLYTDLSDSTRFLCGWSNGFEWSPGCAAFDASGPLYSISLKA